MGEGLTVGKVDRTGSRPAGQGGVVRKLYAEGRGKGGKRAEERGRPARRGSAV